MDKKKKGLADTNDGEFILNESGTSVNTDDFRPALQEGNEEGEQDAGAPPAAEDRSLREKFGFDSK